MSTQPIIRELVETDISEASELLHQMWMDHAANSRLLDTKYIEKYDVASYCMRAIKDPDQQIFVAEADGIIVGISRIEVEKNLPGMYGVDKMAYFDDLVIRPQYRRKGIAGKLIERRLHYAKENNISVCYSKIYSFNEAPQKLMKKHGFEDVYHYYYKFLK